MARRKIMCTSTGCIEYAPERYRHLGIDIIRIRVIFEGKEYLEGLDLNPVEFYERLETIEDPKSNLPKTDMPSTEEIRSHYEAAIADGYDEIMVFAISSGLGGTYNKLSLVAKEFEDRIKITVIDTRTTCFGEGLLAIKAAEMTEAGATTEEILKEIKWMMKHQEFFGVDGKLDYLIYNGRLVGAKALMGKILNFCPVIRFADDGTCVPIESVRTPKKALRRTCELLKEIIGDRDPKDYMLWHIYTGPSLIESLKKIEAEYGIETNHEDVIMSPVSGAHNGPWLAGYGLQFIRRPDEDVDL